MNKKIVRPERALSLVTGSESPSVQARVAFASASNERVDQHFGSATHFVIFQREAARWSLQRLIEYPATIQGHDQDKIQSRIDELKDCTAIYCTAIGPSALRQLLRVGVQAQVVESGLSITGVLRDLDKQLEQDQTPRVNMGKSLDPLAKQQRLQALLLEDW